MTENPNTPADDERRDDEIVPAAQPTTPLPSYEAPHVDPNTLRSAYAFDGSGPYLYAPDGSGPYTYTSDGRGPYLMGSAAANGRPRYGVTDDGARTQEGSGQGGYGQHGYGQHGHQGPYASASGYAGYHAAPSAFGPAANAPAPRRRRLGLMIGAGIAALVVVGAAGGTALGLVTHANETTTSSQGSTGSGSTGSGSSGSGSGTFTIPGQGGSSSGGSGSSSGTAPSSATAASDSQKAGLVTIVSTLDYDSSEQAAGTGMILTSDGEVLTNNHVIDGATSITVTVESTGKQYTANVVGTDSTDDVAVLKLANASGLTTANLDTSGDVAVGDTITDVGNAEGKGELMAAKGSVTALNQNITVQSESGSGSESLSGLIEVSADVVSGDSGGPLLDSDGDVVGMATAASSGTADVTGYAIPITTAKTIADEIVAGKASSTITIGLPAFLGVEVSQTQTTTGSGVTIAGTVQSSPAASAGLAAGDVITSIDGTAVTSADQLTSLIKAHSIGDSVTIGYTTADGTAATATATLVSGPAD